MSDPAKLVRRLWQRGRDLLPVHGFHFDRPLVLLQSDDWGRVGLRDQEGLELLRSAGVALGERPYDFYSLETADDLNELRTTLKRHRDATGRHPCIEMNFIVANLDFATMNADPAGGIHLLPLSEGLPDGWKRPNLLQAYRTGIADGVFYPALHGTTHFCRSAVERNLAGKRGELLRTLWHAGTPYIHWRMPWIGFEYWDQETSDHDGFLSAEKQRELIGQTVGAFAKLFSTLPRSACAPGYRSNDGTHRAWAQHGIRIAQNGSGVALPPHFDAYDLLQISRTVDFEPAIAPSFSVESCVQQAERCFAGGLPAIVSVHSINFHSTVRDFRSRSLQALDEFFAALESRHSDLLYLHDEDLYDLAVKGRYEGHAHLNVVKKKFTKRAFVRRLEDEAERE
jgi:hypothetical protein